MRNSTIKVDRISLSKNNIIIIIIIRHYGAFIYKR